MLRLSKKSFFVEEWPRADFRLTLVLCLSQSHVSNPLNEFLSDLGTSSSNFGCSFAMSLSSATSVSCKLSVTYRVICTANVCLLSYVKAFATCSE